MDFSRVSAAILILGGMLLAALGVLLLLIGRPVGWVVTGAGLLAVVAAVVVLAGASRAPRRPFRG